MSTTQEKANALGTTLALAPQGSTDYAHFQLSKLERRESSRMSDVTCLDGRGSISAGAPQPRYRIEGLLNGPRAWALAHCIDMNLPCSYKITLRDGTAFTGTCYVTQAGIDASVGTFDLELLITREVLLTPHLARAAGELMTRDEARAMYRLPAMPIAEVNRLWVDGTEIPKGSFAMIPSTDASLPEIASVEDLPTAADFALSLAEA
jgi:hypothetical protein